MPTKEKCYNLAQISHPGGTLTIFTPYQCRKLNFIRIQGHHLLTKHPLPSEPCREDHEQDRKLSGMRIAELSMMFEHLVEHREWICETVRNDA
jgi:hypothetical protein